MKSVAFLNFFFVSLLRGAGQECVLLHVAFPSVMCCVCVCMCSASHRVHVAMYTYVCMTLAVSHIVIETFASLTNIVKYAERSSLRVPVNTYMYMYMYMFWYMHVHVNIQICACLCACD